MIRISNQFTRPDTASIGNSLVRRPAILFEKKNQTPDTHATSAQPLFQLLLGSELVGVSALLLAAVGGTRGKTSLGQTVNCQVP
jgi:hypothetical protein